MSFVDLLMHMEGSNNGTTFVDSSGLRRSITASGNSKTSTTQKMFGSSSAYFDGSGDYLTVDGTLSFSGDFTIEFFLYPSAVNSFGLIDARSSATFQNMGVGLMVVSGTYRPDFLVSTGRLTGTTTSVSTGQWTHVAFCRSGSTISAFVGGTKDATTYTYSGTLTAANTSFRMGGSIDGYYYNGYLDELRITNGTALYTANFTPPAAAFSDPDPFYVRLISPKRLNPYFGGAYRIAGTASKLGSVGAYGVLLYDRKSGMLLARTTSASDGSFAFTGIDYRANGYRLVAEDGATVNPLNAAVADLITPVAMT